MSNKEITCNFAFGTTRLVNSFGESSECVIGAIRLPSNYTSVDHELDGGNHSVCGVKGSGLCTDASLIVDARPLVRPVSDSYRILGEM